MRRVLLALLAALGLGAAELEWAGGELTLGEACALLQRAGYPTTLDQRLDPRLRAEVPMIAGGYWDALLTIARAFDCVPLPAGIGPRFHQGPDPGGLPVELAGGPVELAPLEGPRPRLSAHGPLLVELQEVGVAEWRHGDERRRSAGLLLLLRLSPDVDQTRIGPARLAIASLRGADGSQPAWTAPEVGGLGADRLPARDGQERLAEPLALLLPELDRRPGSLRLEAHLRWQDLRRERITLELRPGQRLPVALDDGTRHLDCWLYAAEHAAGTPWQRPGLGLGLPAGLEAATAPRVVVADLLGTPLRDFGQRLVGDQRLVSYTYLHRVAEGPYRVSLDLDLVAARHETPLVLDVPLPVGGEPRTTAD